MKKSSLYLLLTLLLWLPLSPTVLAAEALPVVKIVGDPWKPWMEGVAGHTPTGGLFITITQEVFSRAGLDYEITLFPFKRVIAYIHSGKADVMLMVSKTEERERFVRFTDPVFKDPYFLYYSSQRFHHFQWQTWEDLSPYTLGAVSDFNYGQVFTQAVKQQSIQVQYVSNDRLNLRKLVGGRVDFIILNERNARRLLLEQPELAHQIKRSDKVLYESHYPFGFSKKSIFISKITEINAIIKDLSEDGTLEKILSESNALSESP